MTDRLREALAKFDAARLGVWYLPTWVWELAAAARALVDAEEVWWCETHKQRTLWYDDAYDPPEHAEVCTYTALSSVHSKARDKCRMVTYLRREAIAERITADREAE